MDDNITILQFLLILPEEYSFEIILTGFIKLTLINSSKTLSSKNFIIECL